MINNSLNYEENIEEDELRCQKCKWYFSTLTKPYILPCNHNICQKCLESLKNENKNDCPFCLKKINKNWHLGQSCLWGDPERSLRPFSAPTLL